MSHDAERLPSVRRILVALLLVLVGVPAAALLLRYGTVSPCEALRQEAKTQFFLSIRESGDANAGFALALGGVIVDRMVDGSVAHMGPLVCFHALLALVTDGGLKTVPTTSAPVSPQNDVGARRTPAATPRHGVVPAPPPVSDEERVAAREARERADREAREAAERADFQERLDKQWAARQAAEKAKRDALERILARPDCRWVWNGTKWVAVCSEPEKRESASRSPDKIE
jgi:hypothetical protein